MNHFNLFSRRTSKATKAKGAAPAIEVVPSSPLQSPSQADIQAPHDHSSSVRRLLEINPIAQQKNGSFEDQTNVGEYEAGRQSAKITQLAEETMSPTTSFSFSIRDPSRDSLNINSTGQRRPSFFKRASHFIMHRTMLGGTVQIIPRNDSSTVQILREMHEHVIPGAEFDSAARDTPPRCQAGTRVRILEVIQNKIHDPETPPRMIWISGLLGVGKSAIMQSLAEAESSRGSTFTTLFFSRPNERDDPKKAFPTLAYGIAVRNSEYQKYIGERLHNDPTFLAKTMDEQFRHLFVTPFIQGHVKFGSERWFVFLDGLDECRGEKEQCRIIDLIRDSVVSYAAITPFVWIIASRPEAHLEPPLSKAKSNIETFWKSEIPLDSEESSCDVGHYLRTQFSAIQENHTYSLPTPWPSDRDFRTICLASSGLFVFASTLVDYLFGGDPASRLIHILDVIERLKKQKIDHQPRPLHMLDLLYTQIMSDVPQEILSITKKLLGFYLVEAALMVDRKPVPLLVASNTLELDQHTTYAALRKLHSVLMCPSPDEAENQPIRFYHTSFSDFLSDPSRSQAYYIDLSQEVTHLWQRRTNILRQYGMNRAYSDVELKWLPTDYSPTARLLLLGSAQRRWVKTLVDCWEAVPSDLRHIRLLINQSSLGQVLREMGPTVFLGVEDLTYPADIFSWLDHGAPDELRQLLSVETFPLRQLDLDRLFKSLCAQHWCWRWHETSSGFQFTAVSLAVVERFTVAQWMQAKEILCTPSSTLGELLREGNGIVRVIGFKPADCYVIVGPVTTNVGTTVYYILPYGCSEDS